MEESILLSSGEFSKMCNVSRELLIHYDKTGLLKPQEVHENGYRYYSLEQLYLFDVIRFFVDAGVLTKEVKEYFENRSTEVFIERLQDIINRMKKQQAITEARIRMMKKLRYITYRSLSFPKGEPRLSFWDELTLIVTDIKGQNEEAYVKALSEHSDFCRNIAFVSKFPMGRITEVLSLNEPTKFRSCQLQTWVSIPDDVAIPEARLATKLRGSYAVILHQGGRKTVARSYGKLFNFIKKEGLKPQGLVYEHDMNSYLMSESEEDYLIYISILVDT